MPINWINSFNLKNYDRFRSMSPLALPVSVFENRRRRLEVSLSRRLVTAFRHWMSVSKHWFESDVCDNFCRKKYSTIKTDILAFGWQCGFSTSVCLITNGITHSLTQKPEYWLNLNTGFLLNSWSILFFVHVTVKIVVDGNKSMSEYRSPPI